MRVMSFMRSGVEMVPIEVELTLQPGLPLIHFLGLPDVAVRESALRIRSALREQGFQLPRAQQILVHLKPTHLRKTSHGLDLAVAAALLWETEQLPKPERQVAPCLYGELTLRGEVVRPDDTDEITTHPGVEVFTGTGDRRLPFPALEIRELKDLPNARVQEGVQVTHNFIRPEPRVAAFPRGLAELGEIIAAGEHSALIAGTPGAGKSTLADVIPYWISEPDLQTWQVAFRLARRAGRELRWRPIVKPHPSITPLAMIGGGGSGAIWPGEITRAHGGVLIMDELLEFGAEIQEALREPIESGTISISRGGNSRLFPARFLLVGTTNLCECGQFFPTRGLIGCRCSRHARRRSLARLTGAFTDRFAIFSLLDHETARRGEQVTVEESLETVQAAEAFRLRARGQLYPNSQLNPDTIWNSLSGFQREHILDTVRESSRRRLQAALQVARTIADLRGAEIISNQDLERALALAWRAHLELREWQD